MFDLLKKSKGFIISLLSEKGNISSKRTAGIVGISSLIILMAYNVISNREGIITTSLIDSVFYITVSALLGTAAEKIIMAKKDNQKLEE